MPIYEFYCTDCHTVFNFLSRKSDTTRRPSCPRCGRPRLERKLSRFAISSGGRAGDDPAGPAEFDDSQMAAAMESLAHEMQGADPSDPRQMAGMMRKLYETSGLSLGEGVEEAIRRLEAGEDPDRIEQEMGEVLDRDDPPSVEGGRAGRLRRLKPPATDETLYEM